MFDPGKILIVGGDRDRPTKTAEVIDLNVASPNLALRRIDVLCPDARQRDGVAGRQSTWSSGGRQPTSGFSPGKGAVLTAEMWDPATEGWSKMADASVPRLHHSGALLLPDGRVLFLGGGEPTGPDDYDHYDAEFYSPPYLFKGARPTISAAPATVTYGQTFSVGTPDTSSITQVTWIRLPLGHAPLQSEPGDQSPGLHEDRNRPQRNGAILRKHRAAGPYMLFVLNGNGVPSVARSSPCRAQRRRRRRLTWRQAPDRPPRST